MILPGLWIKEIYEVVTNPTLGIEQIIWSDIPYDDLSEQRQFDRSFQPTRPWPTTFLHLGVMGLKC
jgi:hypothetical protein